MTVRVTDGSMEGNPRTILKVIQKWYSDIAGIRQHHKLVVVIRDNAGENKSRKIKEFLSQKESRIITALDSNNGRMDNLNQQSIPSWPYHILQWWNLV